MPILFGDDDDSSDDDSEGPEDDEEVGGRSTATAEGHSLTLLASRVLVPQSVIEDLYTCMHNLEYGHGLLVKKVITVSDAEVADSIAIGEIGPRVSAVEGQIIGINVWVKLLEEENVFTLATDSCASNLTPIDCMERVSLMVWSAIVHGHVDIPIVVGNIVRWLDDEIPRNRIPTLRRDPLGVARFPRWVEAKVVSPEVESEKWRGHLLRQMYVAIDVATDVGEEDFFPRNGK
ncbi:hypothetical protein Tco_0089676 [Tanacetum coccineum]